MAGPVFYENVSEISLTSGTSRPYYLNGAVAGSRPLLGTVADGDWGYFEITNGVLWETIKGQFFEPNRLEVIDGQPIAGSDGIANVNWPASGQRVIRLISSGATEAGDEELRGLAFWTALAAEVITDLGTFSEGVTQVIDDGSFSVDPEFLLVIDLGMFSDLSPTDESIFWTAFEFGGISDLGKYSEQIITVIDMGTFSDAAGITVIEMGEYD